MALRKIGGQWFFVTGGRKFSPGFLSKDQALAWFSSKAGATFVGQSD